VDKPDEPVEPIQEIIEETPEHDILAATLMGTIVGAHHEDGTPGVYLRYADGTVIHLIASDKQVYAALVNHAPQGRMH
jgi:hypothetical protein